ncbi:methyl-accepting chemotaxis protein [Orenia marismortui]|uniref:Methyl-accepting chemotaxis protein (MCP) signaling protein n=1 Tax=Orenia marismortui TaxID=46469 RepID=A0A4R8H436_9FIRM|nr:methyl-accepting chemotaxis protein [Orenia marismortui]TDX51510.1 methyl-accepting chemotaxis protein (MCP) signaling protein [Orenia marismortui]
MAKKRATKEIRLGIIGGGEIGRKLLEIFLQMNSIQVECISDINDDAPGIKLAKQEQIKTTSNMMEIVQDYSLDLILEVTGVNEVLQSVQDNKGENTELISSEGSYLIYNLIEEYNNFHNQLLTKVISHLDEVYHEIEDDSQNINQLLGQIQGITKNLNMLALNASIEAARATSNQGNGKGFAIVAEEVKNLSGRSSELVDNIEEINTDIRALNARITEVVQELKGDE